VRRHILGITLCLLAVSGCAGGVVECHGVSWYRLGLDDGKAGATGEREKYAASCGADFDAKRYQQGFEDGARR
jgi:hypothetical protein